MEKYNNYNGFENFLRESVEDFRMIPSKKIWHSIYNNMHPDKKWPSITICLLILGCILFADVANNIDISKNTIATNNNAAKVITKVAIVNNNTLAQAKATKQYLNVGTENVGTKVEKITNLINSEKLNANLIIDELETKSNIEVIENLNEDVKPAYVFENTKMKSTIKSSHAEFLVEDDKEKTNSKNVTELKKVVAKEIEKKQTLLAKLNESKEATKVSSKIINTSKSSSNVSYYLTPSYGYRTLVNKNTGDNFNGNSSSVAFANTANNITTDYKIMQDKAALNLELGVAVAYNIAKNIRFKIGAQANYTNFVSKVSALGHPTQTTLSSAVVQNEVRSSIYATAIGNATLNRSNIQVSLPIGADIVLLGNEKIKWYAGASIQPTYVVNNNAFVISSDSKYYVYEKSLQRKLNFNTAVETYLSFKTESGVIFNVGPQVRYQILSSYKKMYNYSEKLYNVGIKIGISTSF
ncbi:MAG: hypothetical protein ABL929_04420 [Ferruginibacter sp.]|nr:hypothetical protein [Ferruginibacter sp.]